MSGDVKEQVADFVPKRIKELRFGILSNQDIVNQAVLEVSDRNCYDLITVGQNRTITRHGPLDQRMGTSSKTGICDTCGEELISCNGHFGYIKLALPAFHVGYFRMIIDVLHNICKDCSSILLGESQRRSFLKALRRPNIDYLQRAQICKKVSVECRKCKICPTCAALNGPVRKVPGHPLKIVHQKFDSYYRSTAKSKSIPRSKEVFDKSFDAAKQGNNELERHLRKALDDMNPLRVLNLFRRIKSTDCELLGIDPEDGRPEMYIWQYVPAPPVSIRPSVSQETATTEDDITNKLGDIIQISSLIRAGLEKGQPVQTIMEQWDYLQIQIAMYINSEVPGLQQPGFGKSIRGFCQRLKGKGGRFRQNLSGKRVDFSGRTVIGPDPNLGIDEVAVPDRVAKILTFPERVSRYNIEKLRQCIRCGPSRHPGANFIVKKDGRKTMLSVVEKLGKLADHAQRLEIGDTVERHLEDGDIVLFNRQPSLHKLSILSHRAKIRPWRTFRLNECVCNPYNADFDGDEMNLHVPQTEEARAEAMELMGVKHNLATPKNGTPIIAAIQDFITAAYLLSHKDNFFDRKSFAQICGYMFNGDSVLDPDTGKSLSIEIPPPSVVKPERLWTGKQIFNVLMRPNRQINVLVNLDAKCKQFRAEYDERGKKLPPDLSSDDAYLVVRNSEVMCGVMDKSTVGDGKKDSVFYAIMRDFGPDHAVLAMNRLAKLSARWLTDQGFSIGISDVTPSKILQREKSKLVTEAYAKVDDLIYRRRKRLLQRDPGCDEDQTMEIRIGKILSDVREEAGKICFEQLSHWNSPLIMAKCGSKGSNINVSQMVASVGQQMIGGSRVADGFQDRTLPHFPKASRQPASKGFVSNSFFSGLTPTEFIFHAMSGREGLVDTAVKTAETGYMSRRLMKSLEDLSAQYDGTVRNSMSGVIQFLYGDDNLDPVDMEGQAKPVNFDRTFTHVVTSNWDNSTKKLSPSDIKALTEKSLRKDRAKLKRLHLDLPIAQRENRQTLNDDRATKKDVSRPISGAALKKQIQIEKSEQKRLMDLPADAFLAELEYASKSDIDIDHLESRRDFLDSVEEYVRSRADQLASLSERSVEKSSLLNGISEKSLREFINICLTKFERSKVQPGHAVGAIGAQSIGEPGTQMTLKTFHFAGVQGMSITQGVPRIREIINASKNISTPVIACRLDQPESLEAARIIRSRIEKTYLRDIITYVGDIWTPKTCYLTMRIDWDAVSALKLGIDMHDISRAIIRTKSLRFGKDGREPEMLSFDNHLRIRLQEDSKLGKKRASAAKKEEIDLFERMQYLKRALPNVVVQGYSEANRAIIEKSEALNANGKHTYRLLVEGYGLKACMNTPGVDGTRTRTNSVLECLSVLGIEAARSAIIAEINSVMGRMDIDPRHMQLLADVMTSKGDVLGITRFGLAKIGGSVLQLASFEKTPDHLFEAAARFKSDSIMGVSECIIIGQTVGLGTGALKVYRPLGDLVETGAGGKKGLMSKGPDVFEECLKQLRSTTQQSKGKAP